MVESIPVFKQPVDTTNTTRPGDHKMVLGKVKFIEISHVDKDLIGQKLANTGKSRQMLKNSLLIGCCHHSHE